MNERRKKRSYAIVRRGKERGDDERIRIELEGFGEAEEKKREETQVKAVITEDIKIRNAVALKFVYCYSHMRACNFPCFL